MTFFLANWFLFAAALVSGALLFWPMLSRGAGRGRVSPSEAVNLINREKGVLVDVSEPAEYATGHAGGSKSVPFGSLETSTDLPRNKGVPVLLLCPTGARAQRGVGLLRKRGYENTQAVAGGTAAWREANLPIERSV
ncbi:MAG: rhodanese-like domain-containing protein [Burkholderiaceae bacterium]|nr:rhodanese-like domain-containing protein [Burkholderiaceae bacterium]